MLAKVQKDNLDDVVYLTVDQFLSDYTKNKDGVVRHISPESREWAKYGRDWTRFVIGQHVFVKAPEEDNEKVKEVCSKLSGQ